MLLGRWASTTAHVIGFEGGTSQTLESSLRAIVKTMEEHLWREDKGEVCDKGQPSRRMQIMPRSDKISEVYLMGNH